MNGIPRDSRDRGTGIPGTVPAKAGRKPHRAAAGSSPGVERAETASVRLQEIRGRRSPGNRNMRPGANSRNSLRRRVTRGERMMADGARMKTEAEASYRLRQVATAPQT
jgi:hypothetical protein